MSAHDRLIKALPIWEFSSLFELSSKMYTLLELKVGIRLLCKGTPASTTVNLVREEGLVVRAGSGAPLALGGRGITGSDDWAVRDDG